MGAEQSAIYDGPPEILEARNLPSVAKYMKSEECKNIFIMLGAGVSTSAGIPDFRSPETGLYANLARLNLPYPEAVFEISFFREDPIPFYTLARELLPGRFRPTPTHSFVRLLADHGLLHTCFTQNIDTLERRAGVPAHKIVEAHGSFASQRCIDCRTEYDGEKMRECLRAGTIARCPECEGLVKPDIVFFGESVSSAAHPRKESPETDTKFALQLPEHFHQAVPQLRKADMLFVIGTSLTVQPFASLASIAPAHCPRVLINLDHVGDFGSRPDDVICLGKCDHVVRELCKELGWEEELDAAWKETENSVVEFDVEHPAPVGPEQSDEKEEEQLEEEVEEITERLERVLGSRYIPVAAGEDDWPESDSLIATGEEVPVTEDEPQPRKADDNAVPETEGEVKQAKEEL
ncbi:NAD-dependent deacetylase sirtuin-2 [Laetiporus sulphureus 93-53]|uniref:NAD-dependent protein deacetylase n=1 Tax=Laetiporus sulphureus 93-53 TaxID=1314785 RepID=A0A165HRI0_9APHY|nr:NAD-dependent deacetylase sirtuin-2 [Laetiporus sulphureus 93-53]KZT12086.1 NAD-dependent deacetylase sirtuin-2 [Laetiporus sulphureus 93-53]